MRALALWASVVVAVGFSACGGEACSAASCPTGCCDVAGKCETGTTLAACGLGGVSCNVCTFTQQCTLGACVGGTTSGTGGGAGGTGGGTGGGYGTCQGGGSFLPSLNVMPEVATMPSADSLELSADIRHAERTVNFVLESGPGRLVSTGISSATYFSPSGNASARVRAEWLCSSGFAKYIDITTSFSAQPFMVVPITYSSDPYALALGSEQTFAGIRALSTGANVRGVSGVEWFAWPSGSFTGPQLRVDAAVKRVYARETGSNIWATRVVEGSNTTLPSISVTPAVSTVSRGGVVQLTAFVSTGESVAWSVADPLGSTGTVNQSGTYTAPSTPGIYVVSVGVGTRFAAATLIVQ